MTSAGKLDRAVGVPIEVTPAQQALLDENRALKAQLAQAKAEFGSFTQAVAHDLRAPVRNIRAFVQVIEEDFGGQARAAAPAEGLADLPAKLPADLANHLSTIADAAKQLAQRLDALVQVSKLATFDFKPEPVALEPLVSALVKGFNANPSIAWHIAKDLPNVQADRAMLTQILQQLIDNAVKFSAGSAAAQVEIGWRSVDTLHGELFVKDNGVGFDVRFQSQLFGIFHRFHAADQFAGLGVGLAIASRLVQRHGGQICATSAIGQGCEMRFTLPMSAAQSV